MMRTVELGIQPEHFFEAYEQGLRLAGFPETTIQALAAVLLEVYRGLMLAGPIRGNPEFQEKDATRPGFSRYLFADHVVAGFYSASPHAVHLEYLTFTFSKDAEAERLIERRNAAVHVAA